MDLAAAVPTVLGVVVGAGLTFAFGTWSERRRERWARDGEWRERRLQAYVAYLVAAKEMRSVAQQVAASVGLDDQAPAIPREQALETLAEANRSRGAAYELVADSDRQGWREAVYSYFG